MGNDKTRCGLLRDAGLACCHAVERAAVVPTVHERERYCLAPEGYLNCPTWIAAAAAGRPLTEGEYFKLWLGDVAVPLPVRAPPSGDVA